MTTNREMIQEKKPIRVLMLVTRLNIGGPAVQVVTLAGKLQGELFETVLACGALGVGEGDMSYLAEGIGVPPVIIPGLGREISLFKDLVALAAIMRLILKTDPDILHTHTAKAGTLGRMAVLGINLFRSTGKKIRVLHTFHGHTFHSYFSRIKTSVLMGVEKLLATMTDRIIAISILQQKDLCERYKIAKKGRVVVMPLGFDLSIFGKSTGHKKHFLEKCFPKSSGDPLLVGLVGRLTPIKNPAMVLEVVDILRQRGYDGEFRFVFVGDGELKPNLERQCAKLQLKEDVTFTGWRKDIARIYSALDAVVLTSTNEGTPVSLIEAMASGTAVIATDVGGVRDLMGKEEMNESYPFQSMEYGTLVTSGDATAMARALIQLKNNPDLFSEKAGKARRFVRMRFTTDRILGDLKTLYLSLIGR